MPASVNWCYMNKQMALSAIWVAPLLPALGRGLTMTGQDSQYLLSFKAVRWKWRCYIDRSHYRKRWQKKLNVYHWFQQKVCQQTVRPSLLFASGCSMNS